MYLPQLRSTLVETTTYSSHGYHGCLLTLWWQKIGMASLAPQHLGILHPFFLKQGRFKHQKNHQRTKRTANVFRYENRTQPVGHFGIIEISKNQTRYRSVVLLRKHP